MYTEKYVLFLRIQISSEVNHKHVYTQEYAGFIKEKDIHEKYFLKKIWYTFFKEMNDYLF